MGIISQIIDQAFGLGGPKAPTYGQGEWPPSRPQSKKRARRWYEPEEEKKLTPEEEARARRAEQRDGKIL